MKKVLKGKNLLIEFEEEVNCIRCGKPTTADMKRHLFCGPGPSGFLCEACKKDHDEALREAFRTADEWEAMHKKEEHTV